jgi:hypothetical protein
VHVHTLATSFRLQGAIEVTGEIRDLMVSARLTMRGRIALFEPILSGWLFITDGILTGHGLLLDWEPA